ncbi:MAG: FIST C-terminal domain-containing protein [Synergistaceae bacterium]|jgi:hypothetical protein|nr:FIST C-terminal domain-containing protein [Synergistaceae bacterium]
MIRTLTAFTEEADDPEIAVSQVLGQLNLEGGLLRNSVGVMSCSLDFMDEGVVAALCERLPFDVVGINTIGSAVSGGGGQIILTLAVLTSDDVSFSAGVSGSILPDYEKSLSDLYEDTVAGLGDSPKLMLVFAPMTHSVASDYFVDILDSISGGVPMFGFVACDFTVSFRRPLVMFNGRTYADAVGVIMMSGDVRPRFTMTSIPGDKMLKRKAVITKSSGNVLMEVNGAPAIEYMKSLGLVKNGGIEGAESIPMIVDYNDGNPPVARVVSLLTPEGYVVLGGAAPVNCTIGIGVLDFDDVVGTASEMADEAGSSDYDFLLVASCMTRNFILGFDCHIEMESVRSRLREDAPFLFTYAGGEICPVKSKDGRFLNRYHNLTLVSCAI